MLNSTCNLSEMRIHRGERNALKQFDLQNRGFEPISKWHRIGLPSLSSLAEKGLVEQGETGIYGPTFKLTDEGRRVAAFFLEPRQLEGREECRDMSCIRGRCSAFVDRLAC